VRGSLVLAVALAASPAFAQLDDPQIADVALTAHQIDIARGKLALSKTKNEEVKHAKNVQAQLGSRASK